MDKDKNNHDNNQLIVLFMKSLDLKVNDMVRFLDLSANTIYNYRTFDTDALPSKVVSKLFDLIGVDNDTEAKNRLMNLDHEQKKAILSKLGKSITSRTILNQTTKNHTFEEAFDFSKLGSRVYVDALMYEIETAVDDVNDYDFISYVRKYKKKK